MKYSLLIMLSVLVIIPNSIEEKVGFEQESLSIQENVVITDNSVNFNLENLQNHEIAVIKTKSGEKAMIKIEREVTNAVNAIGKSLADNTYIISYSTLTEKISYKINVRNNQITSAHSGSYSIIGYFVNSTVLRRTSNKSASYTLNCSLLFRNWTNSLISTINNSNELVVSFKN